MKEGMPEFTPSRADRSFVMSAGHWQVDDPRVEKDPNAAKNGVGQTALNIISTIMGGGIVSIPYAYAVAGVRVGLTVQVAVVIAIMIACVLYLKTRSILQCSTSFSMIANMCLGSYSSVFINALIALAVFGILILYMLLFARIAIQIFAPESASPEEQASIFGSKTLYIVGLSVLICPIIVRKRLQELKFTTYVLFLGVISLTILLSVKLGVEGSYNYRVAQGTAAPVVTAVDTTTGERGMAEKIMDSVNIAVASQGFVIALFPIYGDMKKEARPKMMISALIALTFTCSVYTYLSFVSIAYFGLDNIAQSIFENMKASRDIETTMLLVLFLVIFCCNIPFIFFAGKVSIISIVQMHVPRPTDEEEEEFNVEFFKNPDNF